MHCIDNCVVPAAGLGTRMLPATRLIPKELLPIINVSAIDYLLQELLAARVKNLTFVISHAKLLIGDYVNGYFAAAADHSPAATEVNCDYVFQNRPLGLAHAILQSAGSVGSQAFAVVLPDDLIPNGHSCLQAMMHSYNTTGASVIAVQKVHKNDLHKYGVVKFTDLSPVDCISTCRDTFAIDDIVEKPTAGQAPSSYACIGRYIFSPDIFCELESLFKNGEHGAHVREPSLADAVCRMIRKGKKVNAFVCNHERYDIGNRQDYLKAVLHFASADPQLAPELMRFVQKAQRRGVGY